MVAKSGGWPRRPSSAGVAARIASASSAGEHEQAHARGSDLGERAEADHRSGEAEVGGEEQAGERLGAVLRGGDVGDRRDRALEHQACAGADDDERRPRRHRSSGTAARQRASAARGPPAAPGSPRPAADVWRRDAVSVCASAAAANIANETAPASAREGSCSVPARKLGASEVSRPKTDERDRGADRGGEEASARAPPAPRRAAAGTAGAATAEHASPARASSADPREQQRRGEHDERDASAAGRPTGRARRR